MRKAAKIRSLLTTFSVYFHFKSWIQIWIRISDPKNRIVQKFWAWYIVAKYIIKQTHV